MNIPYDELIILSELSIYSKIFTPYTIEGLNIEYTLHKLEEFDLLRGFSKIGFSKSLREIDIESIPVHEKRFDEIKAMINTSILSRVLSEIILQCRKESGT